MSSFFNPIGLVGENAFNLRSGDFFPSEQATATLRRLKALLELGGFGVLVGEPGVGKSTLLDHLVRVRGPEPVSRGARRLHQSVLGRLLAPAGLRLRRQAAPLQIRRGPPAGIPVEPSGANRAWTSWRRS